MNTDKEEVSLLKFIPENLHDQLKMEVLQQIEVDKANAAAKNKQAVSPMFEQVMDAKKKEREQQNKK